MLKWILVTSYNYAIVGLWFFVHKSANLTLFGTGLNILPATAAIFPNLFDADQKTAGQLLLNDQSCKWVEVLS